MGGDSGRRETGSVRRQGESRRIELCQGTSGCVQMTGWGVAGLIWPRLDVSTSGRSGVRWERQNVWKRPSYLARGKSVLHKDKCGVPSRAGASFRACTKSFEITRVYFSSDRPKFT